MSQILLGNQQMAAGNNVPVITMDTGNNMQGGTMFMSDSAMSSSLAFLVGELEKRDPKLLEPLTSTTWARDIAVDMGGGWVDKVSFNGVGYADAGAAENGLGRGQTNEIPTINVNTNKEWADVFTFLRKIHVPLVDQSLLRTAGRSLDEMMTNGLHLSYDKTVDENVYVGFANLGTYGIVNNPNVMVSSVPVGASGTTIWASKTADEILEDINAIMHGNQFSKVR